MFGSSQELALLDQSDRLCRNMDSLLGIHFVLDHLQLHGESKTHITLAKHTIYSFARKFEAACYNVLTDQVVIICAKRHHEALHNFLDSLTGVFSHLARDNKSDKGAIRIYDLEAEPQEFAKACKSIHESSRQTLPEDTASSAPRTGNQVPLDAHSLDRVDRALRYCDISSLVQRQSICSLPSDEPPQPVFTEHFVSMDVLRQLIAPDLDLMAEPDLFRSLMRTIDRRLFRVLLEDHKTVFARPASFNLAVATLTTQEFLNFAEEVLDQSTRNLVIELDIRDVLANLDDFVGAQPFLRERGCKVLLQGLGINHLRSVDIRTLKADLFKFTWRPGFMNSRYDRDIITFKVRELGPERCMLSHCDSDAAIAFGRNTGMHAFQGHHIDRYLRDKEPVAVAATADD